MNIPTLSRLNSLALCAFIWASQSILAQSKASPPPTDWFTQIQSKNKTEAIKYKNSVALLIYVSNYSKLPPLPSTPSETDELAKALRSQGFRVEIISNPRNKQDLQSALDAFAAKYLRMKGLTDRVIIYFSGHGYRKPSDIGNLLPADTPVPRKDNDQNDPEFFQYALDMEDWLLKTKNVYKPTQILVLLDACFSGSILSSILVDPPTSSGDYLIGSQHASRQFLTAGKEWETVPDKSIFTPLFVRAIAGSADLDSDGVVSVSEIAQYIHVNMKSAGTTPQYGRIRELGKIIADGDMAFSAKIKLEENSSSIPQIQRIGGSSFDAIVDPETARRRARYNVDYYGKPLNNEKVKGILNRLGFLNSSQQKATNQRPYDSLWVGKEVTTSDVKQLAYAMIQAGIELKAIRSFKGDGKRKPMTIEIGAHDGTGPDDILVRSKACQPLNEKQIDNITSIDRTSLLCGREAP
jgi:hypothetical protein